MNTTQQKLEEVWEAIRQLIPQHMEVEKLGNSAYFLRREDRVVATTGTRGIRPAFVLIMSKDNREEDVALVQSVCDTYQCEYHKNFNLSMEAPELVSSYKSRFK